MKELIFINNIYKSFGNKDVLKGVNLKIYKNEILCIMGGSGSGKSVMMKHLMGIIKPDKGEIIIDGENLTSASENESREIISKFGILFQGAALFDSMNIFDNVAFGMRRKRIPEEEIKKIVPEMLKQLGLKNIELKLPSELSGGMQKRAGLARSLAVNPEIMLYDEPTTGVDPITGGAIDHLIKEMRNKYEITSIVITHDIKLAIKIADRIAMLHNGKIIFDASPAEISKTNNEYINTFIKGVTNEEKH